ncbi:MAG: enoyl-CoA hydratase/isomerase family protein [Deltaproteobacteria bacterium]|nr:enoyl-CoA hydratase/isomerase family protein [Deltaproteobacteria bacterium]
MSDPVTITFSGPGKGALSTARMTSMLEALRRAGGAPVLLAGEGNAFSAGLDLKEVVSLDARGLEAYLGLLEELVTTLYEYPGPTAAWINGHAIAGGCVMALACDVRVMTATETARIGLTEVALGLRFPPRTFEMCRRRLSRASFERVVLEAGLYDPRAALSLGLVDALGDESHARARLAVLAEHPRAAYAATKADVRGRLEVSPEAQRRFAVEIVPAWAAPELKARLQAKLAK